MSSYLTKLAAATDSESPSIRRGAVEQGNSFFNTPEQAEALVKLGSEGTAPAVDLDAIIAEIDALKQRVGVIEVKPPPPNVASWPRARADFGGNLQAMVDQMSDGDGCIIDGIFDLTDTLDISDKRSLRFQGYGGTGFNEGGRWGAVLRAMRPGMTLINDGGGGASVNHAGPEFSHITLYADGAHTADTMLRLRNVNHGATYKLSLQGSFKVGIDADVPLAKYPEGDMAYWDLDKLTIAGTWPNAIGLLVGDAYIRMRSANFDMAGDDAYGVKCLRGVVNVMGSKWNHAGHHFYTEGSGSTVIGNDFETVGNKVYTVEVARPAQAPLLNQGTRNLFAFNHVTPHGQDGLFCKFGLGTYGNAWAYNTGFWNTPGSKAVVDEGQDNIVEPKGWII